MAAGRRASDADRPGPVADEDLRRPNHPVHALDGVDLTIEEAESAANLGPSGSGKSTLLYLHGGLDAPDEGTVGCATPTSASSRDESSPARRPRELGFVFHSTT